MSLTAVNEFNLHQLRRIMADWPESELDWQPQSALHSARWLLVHMAIAIDYGLMQCSLPGVCEGSWHQDYGPGSQAGSTMLKPDLAEIIRVIESGYALLREQVGKLGQTPLTDQHEVGLLFNTPLITKGDLVAHILSTHFAFHLGQLSTLRRMRGLPALF
jgi:hypothetical protein